MCDPTPIRNWLWGVYAAILAAVGFIIIAIGTNASIKGALTSPTWMGCAGIATFAALCLCFRVNYALDDFCRCAEPSCVAECSNMGNTVNAFIAVLGIQVTACALAAVTAWVPYFGQAPMWIILGTLLLQVPLIISALVFYSHFADCAAPQPVDELGRLPAPTRPDRRPPHP